MQNIILTTPADLREIIQAAVRSELVGLTKENHPAPAEYLTRKQAAERLQVTLPTIHAWTKSGVLKGYRIANRIRYKESELDSALQAMKTRKG